MRFKLVVRKAAYSRRPEKKAFFRDGGFSRREKISSV